MIKTVLRNIVAITMIKSVGKEVGQDMPHSQAAYKNGRSTTEHVFTYKLLAEKAISSADYTVHFLLMDLSKAFDTISRHAT